MNYSQTQIANFGTLAGLIVLIANQFGLVLEQNTVMFFIGAVFTLGSTTYNLYQRYQKGDISLMGARK